MAYRWRDETRLGYPIPSNTPEYPHFTALYRATELWQAHSTCASRAGERYQAGKSSWAEYLFYKAPNDRCFDYLLDAALLVTTGADSRELEVGSPDHL
jgi:hypothetical protein